MALFPMNIGGETKTLKRITLATNTSSRTIDITAIRDDWAELEDWQFAMRPNSSNVGGSASQNGSLSYNKTTGKLTFVCQMHKNDAGTAFFKVNLYLYVVE